MNEQEQPGVSGAMPPLLLASSSPRRREILGRLGFPFKIVPADLDEDAFAAAFQGSFPDLVEALAAEKALAVAASEPDFVGLILAADTTVILDGEMLSKPVDSAEAERMLRRLRGRAHQVATGVALYDCRNRVLTSGQRCTTAWMRDYSDAEIAAYVASGDPLDKAGGYAVQHALFHPVERVGGCYLTVVGLPLCLVTRLLRERGIAVSPLLAAGGARSCAWSENCVPPLPPGATAMAS
ncbi:MAG TPA: Maf family protein [Ktedonobacterales bacterium]